VTEPVHTALVLDGRSGPALEMVRSLGRAGWRVLASQGTRSAASRFTAKAVPIPESVEPAPFADALADVLGAEHVDLLVPCTDGTAQILWSGHTRFGGVPILGGDRRSFELTVDKAAALAAAERAGFPAPRWLAPEDVSEARSFAHRLALPFVVKPRRSFIERAGRLVQRRHAFVQRADELEHVLDTLREADSSLPVVQEYVPGRSLAVSAVVRRGRVLAAVARETFSFEPIAGGTSVWKRTVPLEDDGIAAACRLLVDIGFEGLAEVEYQVGANGRPQLMEVGARAHGWIGLAVAAGVDLPLIAAHALLGDDLPPMHSYRPGVEMRWPRGELRRLQAALAPRSVLPPGVTRAAVIGRSWPPWRPGMRYDGVDRDDLAPLLPDCLRHDAGGGFARPRSSLRYAPRVVYPLKSGVMRARSLAWLARSGDEAPDADGLRLLFYHRVADDKDELAVGVDRFREQMEVLAGAGYRVTGVVEAVDLLLAGALTEPTIGLSFDDGFRDVAEAAMPVLREHGFRATVFVATGVVDGSASFAWYERQPPVLRWDEICDLERTGTLRFEAHTVTHPNLLALDRERSWAEIEGSKLDLESRLGRPVEAFCYPAGLFGSRERELVEQAGYRMATGCEPGLNRADVDPFALHRQQVDARDGVLEFRAKLNGALDSPLPGRAIYRRFRYGAGVGKPRAVSARA
jgi:peptidoglycan/xylan/chitin deacetylase (PgdA/CDA1 family)/predicted ATP-grasp superfamily ATP-dependent carboligase